MSRPPRLTLAAINALSDAEFADHFADIAEHSRWVAETAARDRPFSDRAAMIGAFQRAILTADAAGQNHLLAAHPDLAGKAKLTAASTGEQAGAGLDQLTSDELSRFQALNTTYRTRFGFPFVLAVRGADKHTILASFETRLSGTPEEERLTALAQVLRIVRFRLEDCF
jgi:2-oxo-4-hydroxy-4-carboxy-5-ureidoimidazoline decarboxylase